MPIDAPADDGNQSSPDLHIDGVGEFEIESIESDHRRPVDGGCARSASHRAHEASAARREAISVILSARHTTASGPCLIWPSFRLRNAFKQPRPGYPGIRHEVGEGSE